MDRDDAVKHLVITGVELTDRELGRGAYGRGIFEINYKGVSCAAKVPYYILRKYGCVHADDFQERFLKECIQHSKLHHPNIVKMLGVFYPPYDQAVPCLVMELFDCCLAELLDKHQNIPMFVKLSILQDVSRAICYLHTLNPPLVHGDLNSDNIVLTTGLVAKVCNFGEMKVASPLSLGTITKAPGTLNMPPEALEEDPHYELPYDIFSFGCVLCHVITQKWPKPSVYVRFNRTEVERRIDYIDQISEGSLKQLVITCLDDDQEKRPPITLVSERITSIKAG